MMILNDLEESIRLTIYRYQSDVHGDVVKRLLRSRTRLSETRGTYLAKVVETNKLLKLL